MEINEFFNALADGWDDDIEADLPSRRAIALLCGAAGSRMLDIACGTGVMFPELLSLGAVSITGVDISEGMTDRAANKFSGEPRVRVVCGDVLCLEGSFDAAVMYNAYPHFLDKRALLRKVAGLLPVGGRFTVGHGAGRETINRHHGNVPKTITSDLAPAAAEAAEWSEWFEVDGLLDRPDIYLISGVKK